MIKSGSEENSKFEFTLKYVNFLRIINQLK